MRAVRDPAAPSSSAAPSGRTLRAASPAVTCTSAPRCTSGASRSTSGQVQRGERSGCASSTRWPGRPAGARPTSSTSCRAGTKGHSRRHPVAVRRARSPAVPPSRARARAPARARRPSPARGSRPASRQLGLQSLHPEPAPRAARPRTRTRCAASRPAPPCPPAPPPAPARPRRRRPQGRRRALGARGCAGRSRATGYGGARSRVRSRVRCALHGPRFPTARSRLRARLHLLLPALLTAAVRLPLGRLLPGRDRWRGVRPSARRRRAHHRRAAALRGLESGTRPPSARRLRAARCVDAGLGSVVRRAVARDDRVRPRLSLYTLIVALMGSFARRRGDLDVALAAVAAVLCGIAAIALATRLAPDALPIARGTEPSRLAFPLTYWNAAGVAFALGLVLALHVSAGGRRAGWVRALRRGRVAGRRRRALLHVLARRRRRRGARRGDLPSRWRTRAGWSPRWSRSASRPRSPWAWPTTPTSSPPRTTPTPGARRRGPRSSCSACALGAAVLRAAALPLERRLLAVRVARRLGAASCSARLATVLAAVAVAALTTPLAERARRPPPRVRRDDVRHLHARSARPAHARQRERPDRELAHRLGCVRAGAGAWHRRRHVPPRVAARAQCGRLNLVDAHSLYLETMAGARAAGASCCSPSRCSSRWASRSAGCAARSATRYAAFAGRRGGAPGPRGDRLGLGDAGAVRLVRGLRRHRLRPAALRGRPRPGRPARRGSSPGWAASLLAVTPATVALSQSRARRARRAPSAPATAPRRSTTRSAASPMLNIRPEPFELIGYCDLRAGQRRAGRPGDGVGADRATRTTGSTPTAWRSRRPSTATTRGRWRRWRARLNPEEVLARDLDAALRRSGPGRWPRVAARARIPQQ